MRLRRDKIVVVLVRGGGGGAVHMSTHTRYTCTGGGGDGGASLTRGVVHGVGERLCASEHKIYVYNFADLKILHQTDTVANPKGLCALSPTQDSTVMACPGLNKGQVRVELYDLGKGFGPNVHSGAYTFGPTVHSPPRGEHSRRRRLHSNAVSNPSLHRCPDRRIRAHEPRARMHAIHTMHTPPALG